MRDTIKIKCTDAYKATPSLLNKTLFIVRYLPIKFLIKQLDTHILQLIFSMSIKYLSYLSLKQLKHSLTLLMTWNLFLGLLYKTYLYLEIS